MKKVLFAAASLILLTPSIALAAWWNPFTWFAPKIAPQIFATSSVATTTIKIVATTTPKIVQKKIIPAPSAPVAQTPVVKNPAVTTSSAPIQQTPTYVMPDKPVIESFCDDKGNCACSSFAESNFNCSVSSNNTVHVGETLNFTIKVSGEEALGVLAFILPQKYDWVKEGGIKPWGTDLTYTKTFTTEDVSARYFMYAYIKSSNDNYHRRSSGCNWAQYSCDDNAQIIYTVLP